MRKYYYIIIAFLSFWAVQAQQRDKQVYEYPLTDIDYNEYPENPSNPGYPSFLINDFGVFIGASPKGANRYTSDGLVLTTKRTGASGFVINDLEIDLRKGAKIEFEYTMSVYTGEESAGYQYGGGGMTFFLLDGSASIKDKEPWMGYPFSALGYSFNGVTSGGSRAEKTGLNGAYLGVGFDLDGNSKEVTGFAMSSYETREGIPKQSYIDNGEKDGKKMFGDFYKNHITLRGATQNNGNRGNPLLLTKYFGGNNSGNSVAMATLDYDTGEYDFSSTDNGDDFNIANGGFDYEPNFQKIEVELVPDGEKGMYVTVKGNGKVLIDRFYYKHSFKTFKGGNDIDELYDFETGIPQSVKVGFVGTTMPEVIQKTIIRNVKITEGIDEGGEGEDEGIELDSEYEEICISDSNATINEGAVTYIDILEDTDHNVDWNTFRFEDEQGNELGEDSYSDSFAKWKYDRHDKRVKMTVVFDGYNPGHTLEVHYSVEIDGVRSKPANITVKGIACGAYGNPQIRTRAGE